MIDKLPDSWVSTSIGEVCINLNYGYTASSSIENCGPKFLRITDIQNGFVSWETVPHCKIKEENLYKYQLKVGDIVFARTGGTVGKSFIIKTLPQDSIFASYLIRISPSNMISPSFLYCFFQTTDYWSQIGIKNVGLQGNVNATMLASLKLPIPPLNEQKRIVTKIEELFSELDNGIESLKKAKEQLKQYRQSVLKKAFEGRLTHPNLPKGKLPEEWEIKPVKKIAQSIQYGYTESSSQEIIGPKFLRITDIQNNRVNWGSVPYCTIDKNEISKYRLEDGDLVFARTGATVGKSFLIKGVIPESVFASYLIRLRFPKNLDGKYIWYYFQSPQYWHQIGIKQVGSGQPNVNGTKLGQIEIVVVSESEQQKIVELIETQFSVIDQLEADIEINLKKAESLRQSILKKAFSGQLVLQDPNDEPASVLLQKIKMARQSKLIEKR